MWLLSGHRGRSQPRSNSMARTLPPTPPGFSWFHMSLHIPELISGWTALKPSQSLVWKTCGWQIISIVSLNGLGDRAPLIL